MQSLSKTLLRNLGRTQESCEEFPIINQPVTVLKDMLLSLWSSLQADMMFCMPTFNAEIKAMESRVDHIESQMGEFTSTINDLVDAHEETEDDMEETSRINNLKIRAVPEMVQQAELHSYATRLFNLLGGIADVWLMVKFQYH